MKRSDVYKLIDCERQYQISRHEVLYAEKPHRDEDHSVADWLIYIMKQVGYAKAEIYKLNTDAALEHIRKITALGVACMEHNETKGRK